MPQGRKYVWAAGLFLATLLAFHQVVHCDFINFDDPAYVQNNPLVAGGLTPSNLGRAFTTIQAGYWIPLTWISYQLDYSLGGLAPGGYHRTNLLLHAANVVLLFLLLCRLTGCTGRSAVVAGLFALHPIQVESVAWVTERKDVLSTFFGLLALGAYVEYAERPNWRRYLAVLLLFALGLMAKPMLVTLPCVLLLLDYWPLRRWGSFSDASAKRCGRQRFCEASLNLLLEKAPLFALALAAGVLTILAQKTDTAVRSLDEFSLYARLGNAAVSCVAYLGMLLWPHHLAVFYPHPGELPAWQVAAAVFVLLVLTGAALALARRAPYLLVGWLWYIITLAPVSGVLQAGWQGRADRFVYVPSIGLFVLATWGLAELGGAPRRRAIGALAAVVLCGCLVRTAFQVRHWQTSLTLWQHTVAVTPANFVADNSLAAALLDRGRAEEALPLLRRARASRPEHELAHFQLGVAYRELGRLDDAVRCWRDALKVSPNSADAHAALAEVLARQGRLAAAEKHALAAVCLEPRSAEARHALGVVRDRQGRAKEALGCYREAVRLNPHALAPRLHLADALRRGGQPEAAAAELGALRRLYPNWTPPDTGSR